MTERRGSGVGRGNGAGSQRTWFRAGMSSANPQGRPRKPRQSPTASLAEALERELGKSILTFENGKPKKRTQAEAMVAMYISRFPKATMGEMLQAIRYMMQTVSDRPPSTPQGASPEQRRAYLMQLAEEVERHEEMERTFPLRHR